MTWRKDSSKIALPYIMIASPHNNSSEDRAWRKDRSKIALTYAMIANQPMIAQKIGLKEKIAKR